MAFDRSKIKGAKVSSITETRKEADKHSRFFAKGYTDFLKIDPGMNTFRIAPPHDPSHTPFVPLRSTWLEVEVDELDDDRNPTGKKVVKNRRIFIATIHGGLQKDPIETYIKYVRQRADDEFTSKDDRQKFLAPITGARDKTGKWNPGISPSTNYVAYAWDRQWNLGRLELYPKDIAQIEKLNIDEDTGEPIETDVFSDPDVGRWLNINLFKNDKGKHERILTKREFIPKKGMKSTELAAAWEEFEDSCRIPDDKLQDWFEKDSLHSIYVDVYTRKDFDMAIEGLSRFDAQHGFGIFENSEFIDELEEIAALVPEAQEGEDGKDEDAGSEAEKIQEDKPKRVSRPIRPPVKESDEQESNEQDDDSNEQNEPEPESQITLPKVNKGVDNTPDVKVDPDLQKRIADLRKKFKK